MAKKIQKTNYDFIEKILGLQGIEVTYTNVINGKFEVYAVSSQNFAVCPRCKRITQKIHDSRCQPYEHLHIWGIPTLIILTRKRYVCDCDSDHTFDE